MNELYIRTKRHARTYSWYLIGRKRYSVIERVDGDSLRLKLLFASDCIDELKIWMDCNGMKMRSMISEKMESGCVSRGYLLCRVD